MAKRIAITGYYGHGNLGDDVLMCAAANIARKHDPDAHLYIVSSSQKCAYIRELLPNVRIIRGLEPLQVDLRIEGGGGVYFDFEERRGIYRISDRLLRSLGARRVAQLERALRRIEGRPLLQARRHVALGVGVGSFALGSAKLVHALKRVDSCDRMLVRDPQSILNARLLRGDLHIRLGADLAFGTRFWKPDTSPVARKQDRIAFVVRRWKGPQEALLLSSTRKTVHSLRQRGFDTRLYAFDKKSDAGIDALLEEQVTYWDPSKASMDEYLRDLCGAGVVVTARAHGAILSAAYGCTSILLEVEPKLRRVHEMLPLSSSCVRLVQETDYTAEIEKHLEGVHERGRHVSEEVRQNASRLEQGLAWALG